MDTLTLELAAMANGGDALGRDGSGRVIFVPFAIPGERVRVEIVEDKGRFAHGRVKELLEAAPERAAPRCPHFGVCGACHWQHMTYAAQLAYKEQVVRDQLARIGRIEDANVAPTLANPDPWLYATDVSFSPAGTGELGFWSPQLQGVMPVEECHVIHPLLLDLHQDIEMDFTGLRRVTLRLGADDGLLVALETDDMEPPALSTDFPVSVALVLPDQAAANLVGDNFVVKAVKGRDFRVSAGTYFYPSPAAAALLVDTVLHYAALTGSESVLELYSGAGLLTAFLAAGAAEVVAIEAAPDAIEDAALNLEDVGDVALYHGPVEEVLPALALRPEIVVADPPAEGLSRTVVEQIEAQGAPRVIYVSSDVATLARDGRHLREAGYALEIVQPIDMLPQTYHVLSVAVWKRV